VCLKRMKQLLRAAVWAMGLGGRNILNRLLAAALPGDEEWLGEGRGEKGWEEGPAPEGRVPDPVSEGPVTVSEGDGALLDQVCEQRPALLRPAR
jgi:hypothetical protein